MLAYLLALQQRKIQKMLVFTSVSFSFKTYLSLNRWPGVEKKSQCLSGVKNGSLNKSLGQTLTLLKFLVWKYFKINNVVKYGRNIIEVYCHSTIINAFYWF